MIIPKRKIRTRTVPEEKKWKMKIKINWKKVSFWMVFASFFGVIIYIFFFSGRLAVVSVEISGIKDLDKTKVEESLKKAFSGKYLSIIPENNLIFIDPAAISDNIQKEYRKIETLEIRKKFPSSLIVRIKEYEPVFVICSSGRCFSVDKEGIAYDEADIDYPKKEEEDLTIVRDMSSTTYNLQKNAVSEDYAEYVSKLRQRARESLDIELERELETPSIVSDDIRAKAREGFSIIFNRQVGMEKSIDMLRAILGTKIDRARLNDLEYIDIRIDNKIYFKFRGDNGDAGSEEMKPDESEGNVQGETDKYPDEKKKKKK
jgi:cell division septal protein FtsQ